MSTGQTPCPICLKPLLPKLVQAAQKVYDEWQQDEEGFDLELGTGGPCDQISQAFAEVLSENGIDSEEASQEGDDHSFLLITTPTGEKWFLDLPYYLYETGAGYSWKKIPGVSFTTNDLNIHPL